jgi:hypothetical protein
MFMNYDAGDVQRATAEREVEPVIFIRDSLVRGRVSDNIDSTAFDSSIDTLRGDILAMTFGRRSIRVMFLSLTSRPRNPGGNWGSGIHREVEHHTGKASTRIAAIAPAPLWLSKSCIGGKLVSGA